MPTFDEFAGQFLKWAKTNLAEATVVLHRVNIDRLKQFFRGKLINEIDRESVEQFKVWRAGQKRKNADNKVSGVTVNRCLTTLKRIFTFRDTYGTRHSQAGTELPVLAELMGLSTIQTTMIYVHAARKQKIEATAKLQAYVEAARRARQLQEEREAEDWKPKEDEWGVPIPEGEESSPQNPPHGAETENLQF